MAVSSSTDAVFESGITIGGVQFLVGAGAPGITAPKGSIFIRTDGSSASTRMYINTTGAAIWTAGTTAA